MLLQIADVLNDQQVNDCRRALDSAPWVDGNVTSGPQSARAKVNEQVPEDSAVARELGGLILQQLSRNPRFIAAALPQHVFPPLFNRYGPGQTFGAHVDNAVRQHRGSGLRIRTDLSATLFLAEPDEYDGGELVIRHSFGEEVVKLPAGHLLLYPSGSLHAVRAVTRGRRLASFFWIQSMVRDEAARTQLLDLDNAIQGLAADHPDHASVLALTGVYHNLLRRWSQV